MALKRKAGRLSMEKVREILRLRELGISKQGIADSCGITRQTVSRTARFRAEIAPFDGMKSLTALVDLS